MKENLGHVFIKSHCDASKTVIKTFCKKSFKVNNKDTGTTHKVKVDTKQQRKYSTLFLCCCCCCCFFAVVFVIIRLFFLLLTLAYEPRLMYRIHIFFPKQDFLYLCFHSATRLNQEAVII